MKNTNLKDRTTEVNYVIILINEVTMRPTYRPRSERKSTKVLL